MARALTTAFLLVLVSAAGCGPLRVGPAITLAEDRLADLSAKGVREDAPYEMTAAARYLDLAREARGRSEYSAAQRFAEEASRNCLEARDVAPRNRALREARKAEEARNPAAPAAPAAPARKGTAPAGAGGTPAPASPAVQGGRP